MKNYLIEVEITLGIGLETIVEALITKGLHIDISFKPRQLSIKTGQDAHNTFLIKGFVNDQDINRYKVLPFVKNCWSQSDYIPFYKMN